MAAEKYDAIVIGSGQGGTPLAKDLAKAGHRTALIERDAVGGTCINRGCTPTKTMYASARVAAFAKRAREYGVDTGTPRVLLGDVRRRKQAIVDAFRDAGEQSLRSTQNLDLIKGEARFVGARALEVKSDTGARRLEANRWIFIAT